MKNYVYIACLTLSVAVQARALPFKNMTCCNTRAMATSVQARTLEQQAAHLQAQYADNPGAFKTHIQEQITQREQAIDNGKQRQKYLEKLYAQLADDTNDSQDNIPLDAIISVVSPDNGYISDATHTDIAAQYQEAEDAWYPDSATGVDEKAALAYLCAQAIEEANGARVQEVQKLKAMLN